MIKIKEVEMIKAITSLFIIKVRITLKITQTINETTRAIQNLTILKAVNKSFILNYSIGAISKLSVFKKNIGCSITKKQKFILGGIKSCSINVSPQNFSNLSL